MKNLLNQKKITHIVLTVGMTATIMSTLNSCKKNGGESLDCDIRSDTEAVTVAGQAFNSNPTEATCQDLKDASIKLMEKVDRCPGGLVTPEMRESLEEMRNTDCSDYE